MKMTMYRFGGWLIHDNSSTVVTRWLYIVMTQSEESKHTFFNSDIYDIDEDFVVFNLFISLY